jgi:hypothetical protein
MTFTLDLPNKASLLERTGLNVPNHFLRCRQHDNLAVPAFRTNLSRIAACYYISTNFVLNVNVNISYGNGGDLGQPVMPQWPKYILRLYTFIFHTNRDYIQISIYDQLIC